MTYPKPDNVVALRSAWPPDAISFDALRHGKPLRYIYLDEAGTSAQEPSTVVAGIIVDADSQYVAIENHISFLLQSVPAQHRKLVPHAKSIFHGEGNLREGWSFQDRRLFIKQMIGIAPALRIPVSMGIARRGNKMDAMYEQFGMKPVDHHHMLAFALCVGEADRYIVKYGRHMEVATLVAENIPERERFLNAAFESIKTNPLRLSGDQGPPSQTQQRVILEYTVSRIRDTPHFVAKQHSPLLWIADALSFAYARWLSGGSHGAELIAPIIDPAIEEMWKRDEKRLYASLLTRFQPPPAASKPTVLHA
jgi:hypothetical protein